MTKSKLSRRLSFKEKFWGLIVLLAVLGMLLAFLTLKNSLIEASPSFVAQAEGTNSPSAKLLDVLLAYYQNLFLPVGGVLAGIMIIYAGIVYASSAGEPGRISVAKEIMAGAILGFILLLGVGFVVKSVTPPEGLTGGSQTAPTQSSH